MNSLDLRIRIIKISIASIIVLSVVIAAVVYAPNIKDAYHIITRNSHLSGEVYTAKDLSVTTEPIRIFYDKWYATGYEGDFIHDDYHFKHGVGMYIPSSDMQPGQAAATQMGIWLGGEFEMVYFKLCTDSVWTSGEFGGTYRIICYVDGNVVKDTDFQAYDYVEDVYLNVSGANDLVIELQQIKGASGTQNVILGEFEVNKTE